ncbi:MAG: ATP-dependent DNA helicase RecG [Candidatus Marinimicrobia bacterium]|nr:ATP-dependent DNA helicase RecG [Candidatus Neomarinimicrobiota bacterium]
MQTANTSQYSLQASTPVTYVKGIGPRRAEALEKSGIHIFQDLLYHFPRRYLDRSTISPIASLKTGTEATIVGKVVSVSMVKTRRRPYFQALISDDSGQMRCVWFNGAQYIQKVFKPGETVAMSGKVEYYGGLQFVHPDYDILESGDYATLNTARIIPLYHSTAELKKVGLDSRGFRRLFHRIFKQLQWQLPEILPGGIPQQFKLYEINQAFRQIHFPDSLENRDKAVRRFKYEELFFLQLLMAVKRRGIKERKKTIRYTGAGDHLKTIYAKLPFELTDAQKKVVHEIWNDMKSDSVMNRLLQGDVGSGKTVVALLCASIAIGNGYQAAVMAPTEILAEQHYRTLHKLGEPAGIKVRLLIGGQRKTERETILAEIEGGTAELIVGTHALIQENVTFRNLALVVIDEQHRFGVLQRSQLIEKGLNPDVLVMTATPIPRTMSMTLYGDMDVSILDELPARKGRVITRIVNVDQLDKVYDYIKRQVKKGDQAYIVYPLIEESAKLDLQAALKGYDYLREHVFPEMRLALIHGGMKTKEKDEIMQRFTKGTVDVLVSTTVIEVGVDNPNATIMVIENAERFGLTQIHQLRGRIGRGEKNGVCVLVERKRTETSHKRLGIINSTTNGFEISEQDLKLRGPGEFYGTRQHGFPKMKIADLIVDKELLKLARHDAFMLIKSDPHLRHPNHAVARKHFLSHYSEFLNFINVL